MKVLFRLITLLVISISFAQNKAYQIEYFTTENGLSSNVVYRSFKSSNNFMWFGTSKGLTKFDSYDFTTYTTDDNVEVYDIEESTEQILWCATSRGLVGFDLKTETFLTTPKPIPHKIYDIEILNNNTIWAVSPRGLYTVSYDATTQTFENLKLYSQESHQLPSNDLKFIAKTPENELWIATRSKYIFKFTPDTETILTVSAPEKWIEQTKITNVIIRSIYYHENKLFISTRDWGLTVYDIASKTSTPFLNIEDNIRNMETFDVVVNSNNVWTATLNGIQKLNITDDNTYNVEKQKHPLFSNQSQNIVHSLYYDPTGILWASTKGSGIIKVNFYHPENKHIVFDKPFWVNTFHKDKQNDLLLVSVYNYIKKSSSINDNSFKDIVIKELEKTPGDNVILCSTLDNQGNLWFGGNEAIVKKIEKNGKVTQIKIPYHILNNTNIKIRALLFDTNNNLWIGTTKGLLYYNISTKIFQKVGIKNKSDFNPYILTFHQGTEGKIYIGTLNGLYTVKIEKPKQILKKYTQTPPIICITETKKGTVFLGTRKGLFQLENDSIQKIPNLKLPYKSINCITSTKNNVLWMGTYSGICKYDLNTKKTRNYYVGTHINSAFVNNEKQIYFGTKNGFIKFNYQQEQSNNTTPKPLITNLKINGEIIQKEQEYNGQQILTSPISNSQQIELNYKNRNFELEFSSLSYLFDTKNKYAYKLDGYDTSWNYSSYKKHNINYQNLSPGKYTFKVKARNNDGIWNKKPTKLNIVILPIWWETWWFKILLFLGISSFFVIIYKIKSKQDAKKQQLEYAIEKEKEVTELKINFFTNLSHEIRTPLTLIISPLKEILETENLENKLTDKLNNIHQNSQRLLTIVNQLLDFKKIERHPLEMTYTKANINAFVQKIMSLFNEKAKEKDIELRLAISTDEFWVELDAIHLETAIVNLLSNALKYTPNEGKISIEVNKTKDQFCTIIISDTGKGIAKEHLNKLFDRFYQVPNQKQQGTGIGLALAKEIIQQHNGSIQVDSELNNGTTFSIKIPIIQNPITTTSEALKENLTKDKETILIVEDTQELLEYICSLFQDSYNIIKAKNGKEGLKKADELLPSLIISDVMMPEMDGIELCEKLKNNDKTSYIPLLLLTAKSSDIDKVKGLETGADDYIIKPFNSEILKLKVDNFITNKKNTKAYFQQTINPQKSKVKIEVKPEEQQFINNAISAIEKHLTNPDFNSFTLADELHMSKATLYRRIKSFTDLSINHFIRSVRIKKSAEYLLTKEYSVKEISYMVGYPNVTLFRKYFVEQFGVTPSKYGK